MSQGKRWCFTLNNYTEDEYESAKCFLLSESSYFILGKEQGDAGTPHIQGYCELKRRYRFSSLKAKISERSHLELARGTGEDNVNYCSKGGSFFQSGRLSNYRRRSEESRDRRPTRDELATSFVSSCDKFGVLSGCAQFAADNPGTFYYSGFNLLRNYWSLKSPPSRPDISVWWYYGPPGSGKSRRAFEELPEAYRKDARTKWYHGYMGQESCVIDDFGPNCIDIGRLLVWFDRYPCNVESKGGMVPLCVVKFIVTSNFSPEECFKDVHGAEHVQTPALLRRINVLEIL